MLKKLKITKQPNYMNATSLSTFQREFGDYIRKQSHDDGDSVPSRVGQLYQRLIYNNISGFINKCFVICRQIIDDDTWQALLLSYIKDGDMSSPYFSEINRQFVDYLQNSDIIDKLNLYPFIGELAHYEWIELYVDNLPNTPAKPFLIGGTPLAINSTLQVLRYDYAVDKISTHHLPDDCQETFILVYRKSQGDRHTVAFMNINVISFIILTFIQTTDEVYDNIETLKQKIASYFDMDISLLDNMDELVQLLTDHQVIIAH